MNKCKVPVEVAGYVNRLRYVVDISTMEGRFRWMSVINDNYRDDEIAPWDGDSTADSCPF